MNIRSACVSLKLTPRNKVEPAINSTGFYSSKIAIANQLVLISKVCANRRLNYLGPVVEYLWENLQAAGE